MTARDLAGAIVGFGQVAEKTHVPAFARSPDFTIAAVAEESLPRRQTAAALLPRARIFSNLEEMLAAKLPLDFLDIATPPFLHGGQTLAALKSGFHVLCEKPLTLDAAGFQEISRAALAQNRAVWTVHNWAYSLQWLALQEALRAQDFGKILNLDIVVLRQAPAANAGPGAWRTNPKMSGGGILVDHGWHQLYLIHQLLGPASDINVEKFSVSGGVEDEVILSLRCPHPTPLPRSGRGQSETEKNSFSDSPALSRRERGRVRVSEARLHLSWKAKTRSNRVVVQLERGRVELLDDLLRISGPGPSAEKRFAVKLSESSAHPDWFCAMLPDFKAAIFNSEKRAQNLREAGFCSRAIAGAYQEAAAGEAQAAQ